MEMVPSADYLYLQVIIRRRNGNVVPSQAITVAPNFQSIGVGLQPADGKAPLLLNRNLQSAFNQDQLQRL